MASISTQETDFFLKKLTSIPKAMGHDDLELTRSKPIYRYTTSQGSSSLSSPYQPTPDLLNSFQPQVSQRHGKLVLQEWSKIEDLLKNSKGEGGILLDGSSLDIPQVAAVSRYGIPATISSVPEVVDAINSSVKFLDDQLLNGRSLYGITTGFGGSADTRTQSIGALQVALLQMQHSGILPVSDHDASTDIYSESISNDNMLSSLAMPESWVKSAMLIRCNSLIRGHSAVRLSVIESLVSLIRYNYIPLVPLRGSISASGDLSPLSYIAGLLEGNPDILVWTGDRRKRTLITADKALAQLNITPIIFGAKEGLGILNGTAVSAGVASLALQEANQLAVLSQVLTAMGVEALCGEKSSFDPFIAKVRPHSGQTEVAQNITSFLKNSKLIREDENDEDGELRQDRYALRTSSQWVGPQLEDLLLAHTQLATELNSTTDNPLIDVKGEHVHHGGNFQAAAVTSSTEKTRSALQMIGKMIFAQSTELLDVSMNNGLPPNLAVDDPSLSYTFKGVDINMAAYMSELAFVASPVSTHVHSAEMGNQAINSMALVSARYTHTAIDILSLMCSAYLYALCQALDLRAMQSLFLQKLKPAMEEIVDDVFGTLMTKREMDGLKHGLWPVVLKALMATRTKDADSRFIVVAKACQSTLLDALELMELAQDEKCPEVTQIHIIELSLDASLQATEPETSDIVIPDSSLFATPEEEVGSDAVTTVIENNSGHTSAFINSNPTPLSTPELTLKEQERPMDPHEPISAPKSFSPMSFRPVTLSRSPSSTTTPAIIKPIYNPIALVRQFTTCFSVVAHNIFTSNRTSYLNNPDAKPFLGVASSRMYKFLRDDLDVPMHRGLIDHPVTVDGSPVQDGKRKLKTTGSQISIIYQAMRSGRLSGCVMGCLEEAEGRRGSI